MKRCHHGVREPERTSTHSWIVYIHQPTCRAVACIIRGHHSAMPADELEPVRNLNCGKVLGQGPASYGLKMRKTPRRQIFNYAKETLGAQDAPLSPPRSDAGESVLYGLLDFEQCVLNGESLALHTFGVLIAQGCCETRISLKLMYFPRSNSTTPPQKQRCPVYTTNGVPRLLPNEPSVRRLTTMKIFEAASRAIGAKFQARQLPSGWRWLQRREL